MNYKETVNLPETPFPMRADLLKNQERTLRRWQAQSIYRSLLEERRDARPYVIHDGPPYAVGDVHVGIGMNKILKDVVAKYRAMNDRRVPLVPGWDCHGLPIELEVRKQLGARASEASVGEIRDMCQKHVRRYVDKQKKLFQLLGIFADWDRPYLTMAPSYEAAVLTILARMVAKGYVYRALRPVSWCIRCRTPLADTEIDYRRVPGPSVWVHFEGDADLAERCGAPPDQTCSLLVWTTTPWSLPGNVAVAAHPELTYGVFAYRDGSGTRRTTVALAPEALQALGAEDVEQSSTVAGKELAGLKVAHPLLDRRVPVVSADYISEESGTGLVHIAPGHGLEDFHIGRKHGLQVINPIDEDGIFGPLFTPLLGMSLEDAEKAILETMTARGSLAALATQEHEYPHCTRCAGPTITRATEQWFLDLDHREDSDGQSLRDKALLEVEVTQWLPAASRTRIRGMIESRPDWCISRQRVWGVPIPSFVCHGCNAIILTAETIRHVRDQVAKHGSDLWFERPAAELMPSALRCLKCGGTHFEKGSDILDVWFESGASWQPVLVADHRGDYPADLYIEGSDQHRGWFQLSLYPSLASRGRAPYRSVLTHGFVLNEEGRRMRRSQGDLITLGEVLNEVPVDLVRLFFTSVDVTSDIPLSRHSFDTVRPIYRNVRNTFRYLLGNLYDFVPREHSIHLADLQPLDLWVLSGFHHLIAQVSDDYAAFRFHSALHKIHSFCNEELSKLYFDILKDRLYCEAPFSALRRSAQTVLHSILVGLVKLLAPILPYTCEEVWDLTPGHGECSSVHMSRWPRSDEVLLHTKQTQEAVETFERQRRLRDAVKPALEEAREKKTIAKDSDAAIELYVRDGLETFLGVVSLADLGDFLLVSEVVAASSGEGLQPAAGLSGVSFRIQASDHPECVRCRRRDAGCGSDAEHPQLCRRCSAVVRELEKVPEGPSTAAFLPISEQTRPADLAAFMQQRDLRKVAFLNEEGRCRPYALHPPSHEVRVLEELQPLADYINNSLDFRDHAGVLLGLGEHTDVLFGIGIHHLNYGTPLGGTREYAYATVGQLINNLLRLSWGMSIKNAIAELPHAGGKSIIDTCGWDLKIHRELRREIYRDFGQLTASLFGRYICAEDVGNTNADTREMLYACRHVMCLSQGVGGSGNPSRFTALAAWAAAKAGWKFLTGDTSFAGRTIALQGCGNVGSNFVAILIEADPDIGKLLVADRDPEQIRVIRNLLLKKERADVLEVVSSLDPRLADQGTYVEREDEAGKDYVLYAPCDILIPAAVGNVIQPENVPRLNCKLILPISNNVYSDNDAVAQALDEREIVDVVENNINWGGAMAAASETFGYDEKNVAEACIEAYDKTLLLLEEARDRQTPPWELIKERASRRIFHEVHPAVRAAREYKFIGDVSTEFSTWVKEKWLREIVDVAPEEFPRFALDLAPEGLASSRLDGSQGGQT